MNQPETQAPERPPQPEPTVVGIGASAGGLAALKAFFAHVPADSGLAFVVVIHLSPKHESHMADLLQPHVKMPVRQVTETVPLEANHVYIIPPNANLDAVDTHLRLSELEEKRRERAPIDHFFRTLAKTHDGHAIGVILSGTGSDGTLGMKEITERGGLTLVQDPNEAEYDGMPQSAIATGLVDLVLPLAEMPEAILRLARTAPQVVVPEEGHELESDGRQLLQKIFAQLRARTGRDFSRYKRSTIMRRITRRMQLAYLTELEQYLNLLREQPEEVRRLADDLLVTVTSFFRDPEVFQKLESDIIPRLFEGKTDDDEVRVWSVGCATGEEAYSLAILLLETAARYEAPPHIQIFASDLHEHSLAKAREGFYPGDIETDVSGERLRRFFVKENGGYRIRKEIRELVVFAPHNLLGDPPFSRLELIACRNLLIYLQRDLQNDVIELFHYALRPEGYLVLGTSETLDITDLFRTEDKKLCVFRKRNVPGPELRLSVFPLTRAQLPGDPAPGERGDQPLAYGPLHQRLVERYTPPSLLVSQDDKVVHLSEHAGRYLVHPGGELTSNVFKLVREELRIELRAALQAAREKGEAPPSKPIPIRFNGQAGRVVLHVRTAPEPEQDGFALVIFDERETVEAAPSPAKDETAAGEPQDQARIDELETELNLTRQRLQAIIEEYETSQEEMRASNEEMQSTNEELRSTLEELETSKEELQSMNEELQTVNQENRHKVEELAQLSGDLQNLMAATDIATLFLDRTLRIMRFTPKVSELFNVRITDRGRPLADLTHRLGYPDLIPDVEQVLEQLIPVEREIRAEAGRWYLTRVLPYLSTDNRIAGIVITFVDITRRKQAEESLREAKLYAERIIDTLHEPLLVLTRKLQVRSANQAFYAHFEVRPEETEGRLIYELGNNQWNIPALRTLLEEVLQENNGFNDFEVEHDFEQIGRRVMLLNGRRLDDVPLILLGIRDITERKRSEEALRQSEERLQRMINIEGVGVLTLNESGALIGANDAFLRMHGYSREEVEAGTMTWRDLTPAEYVEATERQMQKLEETGRIGPYEKEYLHKDGSRSWMLFAGARLSDGTTVEYCIDVSDRKRAEEALQQSEERFRLAVENLLEPFAIYEAIRDDQGQIVDFRVEYANEAACRLTGRKREDYIGHTLLELYPDLRQTEIFDLYVQTVNEGEALIREQFPFDTTPQGRPEKRYFDFRITRFGDGFTAAWRDVTERTLAEEALRQSERRFREIFETAGVSVWVEDFSEVKQALDALHDQGVDDVRSYLSENPEFVRRMIGLVEIVDVNNETLELFGAATKAELLDSLATVFVPETEAIFIEELVALAEGRESLEAETPLQMLDGRRLTVLFTVHFGPPSGNYSRVVVTLTDITAHKQAEEALQRSNEQLEQRVAERTLELAERNQRLRQLALQLTHAEQQERRRIARTLHDGLQQFLVAAKIHLPMTLTDRGPEIVARLETIFDEAHETARSLSYELSPPTLYSSDLPDALEWLIEWFAGHHEFEVELTVEDGFPALPDQLKVFLYEAIRELLLNAVKYSGEKTATITLHPAQAEQITLTVSDHGLGFDPAHLEQQSENLSGFGLFSIRERLIALGGSLQVDSIPDNGARFILTVPVTEMADQPELLEAVLSTNAPAARAGRPRQKGDGPIRVLIVDDHAVLRDELTALLEHEADIDVAGQAGHGLDAVEQAAALQPDVIIMDVEMPQMNGIEATRRIKEAYPDIVIIGLSINNEPAQREKMEQAGAAVYLHKEREIELLVKTIRNLV